MNDYKNTTPSKSPASAVALKRFFYPCAAEDFADLEKAVAGLPPPLKPIGDAFEFNIKGASSTLSIPFMLAFAGANRQRLDRLYLGKTFELRARLARAGNEPVNGKLSEEQCIEIEEAARRALMAEHESKEGMDALGEYSCSLLEQTLGYPDVDRAVDELLRQGIVLYWGSFETLAKDLLARCINIKPQLARRLCDNPSTKRMFGLASMPFETLEEYGFNLSDRLGDVIVQRNNFGGLPTIKETFMTLFGDQPPLRSALSHEGLLRLAQQRHVIVHNRGIVDRKYQAALGEAIPEGEPIRVSVEGIREYLRLASDSGGKLLEASSRFLAGQDS